MNNKEKFEKFLESIKTDENATLIESVKKGFDTLCEFGSTFNVAPVTAIGGKGGPISSNIPASNVLPTEELEFDKVSVDDEEVPDIDGMPDMSEAPDEVTEQLKADMVRLLANPEYKDYIKQLLIDSGEI